MDTSRKAHAFYGNQYIEKRSRLAKKHSFAKSARALGAIIVLIACLSYKTGLVIENDVLPQPKIISPLASSSFKPVKHIVVNHKTITLSNYPLSHVTLVKSHFIALHKVSNDRAGKLQIFLSDHNSPLAPYAKAIVQDADKYAIDYTLIPAIAGKESSFGNATITGSYNAWGVMAWDAQGRRSLRHFDSWLDGIDYEAHMLATNYRFNAIAAIGAKYCPKVECSETWAQDVTSFSEQIASE